MLVLSRKIGEGIVFSGPGRVVVVEIRGDKVRLGFEADSQTSIYRDEIAEAIRKEGVKNAVSIANSQPNGGF